jgi:hypothetical protein
VASVLYASVGVQHYQVRPKDRFFLRAPKTSTDMTERPLSSLPIESGPKSMMHWQTQGMHVVGRHGDVVNLITDDPFIMNAKFSRPPGSSTDTSPVVWGVGMIINMVNKIEFSCKSVEELSISQRLKIAAASWLRYDLLKSWTSFIMKWVSGNFTFKLNGTPVVDHNPIEVEEGAVVFRTESGQLSLETQMYSVSLEILASCS